MIALLPAACGGEPPQSDLVEALDLVAALPTAEVVRETDRIEIGKASATGHLGPGWSYRERSAGRAFRWTVGERSEVEIYISHPRALELEIRAEAIVAQDSISAELIGKSLNTPIAQVV